MVSEAVANGDVAALNYFIAEKYLKAFAQLARFAEPEDPHAADRGDERARLARRHRRDRQGDVRRRARSPRAAAARRRSAAGRTGAAFRPSADAAIWLEEDIVTGMFASLGSWNWFIVGVHPDALEILAPGTFMLWLGLAALLVGADLASSCRLAVAGAVRRLRGVRDRRDPAVAAAGARRQRRSRAIRSSTGAPTR